MVTVNAYPGQKFAGRVGHHVMVSTGQVYLVREGCPHCEKEKAYLKKLMKARPEVRVKEYEVWKNKEKGGRWWFKIFAGRGSAAARPTSGTGWSSTCRPRTCSTA